jgi:hypothetical protein
VCGFDPRGTNSVLEDFADGCSVSPHASNLLGLAALSRRFVPGESHCVAGTGIVHFSSWKDMSKCQINRSNCNGRVSNVSNLDRKAEAETMPNQQCVELMVLTTVEVAFDFVAVDPVVMGKIANSANDIRPHDRDEELVWLIGACGGCESRMAGHYPALILSVVEIYANQQLERAATDACTPKMLIEAMFPPQCLVRW